MTTVNERKRLTRIIERFKKARILVVGDIVLDHFIWGNVSRISPEAPVPVVNVTRENVLLGGASNVAHNISVLGGKVAISGVVGEDSAGRELLDLLRSHSIEAQGVLIDPSRPTTIKTRIIAHSQQVVRFDRETKERLERETHNRLLSHVKKAVREGLEGIIISDYSKGVITRSLVRDIVKMALKEGLPVAVDPKVNHFSMYSGVTIITPNIHEASLGSNISIVDESSLLRAGELLLKRLKCAAVLITRGEQGMSLFERGGKITHIPTVAREVYDVTGAGDTVIGTLTLSMSVGATMLDAARIANYAAGIVVGIVGTSTVGPETLQQRILAG